MTTTDKEKQPEKSKTIAAPEEGQTFTCLLLDLQGKGMNEETHVKFNDQALSKIMGYFVDNFSIIRNNQNSNDKTDLSSGAFFGRNIQFLPRSNDRGGTLSQEEETHSPSKFSTTDRDSSFLPRAIREYMRERLYFQRGLAQGIGQNFYLLDPSLQQEILEVASFNPEFSNGLGGGLGSRLELLDLDIQNQVFESALKSPYFARGLGESLGLNFSNISDKLRSDAFSFSRQNIQFADGLGQGIGKTLSLLDSELQKKVLDLTRVNGEFARGVGWGLGYNVSYLDKSLKSRIMEEWIERNMEIARGVAMGIGRNFRYFETGLQDEYFGIARRNIQFAEGLGIELAFSFASSLNLQNRILAEIGKNIQLAEGLGIGLGYLFTYLDDAARSHIFLLADTNIQFADGLGYGIGISFSHLHQDVQKIVYEKVAKNLQFAIGFGFGLGYMFNYIGKDMQKQLLFAKMDSDVELAKGLGNGMGYIFKHLPSDIRNLALARASENPHFAVGLGTGFGYTFAFAEKSLQDEFFDKAERNIALAEGLGMGIGRSFQYLSREDQRELFGRSEAEGSAFARGLGYGLGYTYSYHLDDTDFQQLIFKRAEDNRQFAIGLGNGIGYSASYLVENFQIAIHSLNIDLKDTIPDGYLRGLGIGLGSVLRYICYEPPATDVHHTSLRISSTSTAGRAGEVRSEGSMIQKQLQAFIRLLFSGTLEANEQQALGDQKAFTKFVEIAKASHEFIGGFGEGLGRTIEFMGQDSLSSAFERCVHNPAFAVGLAVSIGYLLRFMKKENDELRESIFHQIEVNTNFAQGLGFGLAQSLSYMPHDENIQDAILEQMLEIINRKDDKEKHTNRIDQENFNKFFAKGFGSGAGFNFHHLSERVKERLLYWTSVDVFSEYTFSLAKGIGHNFRYLEDVTQIQILKWAEENADKTALLANEIGRNIIFLSPEIRAKILQDLENDDQIADSEFALELASGLGYCFPSLHDEFQFRVLQNC